ncbi:Lrp/AsnC family transcriptional regulator [Sinomonas sp. JGH33]|uniref:Lrp/AsnC family transcriptional regulator n=1 Tax=Sinomonas terricola TaxID=3110330 RepID=A0ABU5T7I4_9MICC|nr:Lrp/AsnC family transcriptional regulator [Sinomonas sp. JGH33]MEA5455642.1 Lrp/AsnC family transcriptional regulator [Sinomonas sp. JGH33]
MVTPTPARELDELDRRIVAALQVNGRASWRRIAEVLGEPFRTVTRRGIALLESGTVRVAGLVTLGPTHLVEVQCEPARLAGIAEALAADPDANFLYALTGPTRLIMEVQARPGRLSTLVLEELPALDGVVQVDASPVMEYFRTVAEWHPGPISQAQVEALQEVAPPQTRPSASIVLDDVDAKLVSLLISDGRVPTSELCDAVGLSAPAVRRRLSTLFEIGALSVRAIVEPDDIGLPIEAVVWIRTSPTEVAEVGKLVAAEPGVRYAVMAMGEFQLMANVTLASLNDLRGFVTSSAWASRALALRSSLVVHAYKRGGVRMAAR